MKRMDANSQHLTFDRYEIMYDLKLRTKKESVTVYLQLNKIDSIIKILKQYGVIINNIDIFSSNRGIHYSLVVQKQTCWL